MYNLVNILVILLAIWAGFVLLHGIIRKKFDPRSSRGNLMIYILFHAAMIFLLVLPGQPVDNLEHLLVHKNNCLTFYRNFNV